MEWSKSHDGQSSLEVMIALALFALSTVASFVVFGTVILENELTEQRQEAQNILDEGMEAARQIRHRDWDALTVGTHGLTQTSGDWTFSGTEDTVGMFTRTVTVTAVNDNERDIVVTVTWLPRPNHSVSMEGATRLTNWLALEVWGNWGDPYVVGSMDIGPEGKGTAAMLLGDEVYLTAESASGQKPSFFSIDVDPPTNPTLLDSVTTSDDLKDVVVVESDFIAYTVGGDTNHELRVFDVSDPSAVVELMSIDLNANGHSLYIVDTILYVGAVNGLHIFDISTPTSPTLITSYNTGSEVKDVVVEDGYAYVAGPHDSEEAQIIDVRTPSVPVKVWSYNFSGNTDGLSVSVRTSKLYVGRYNISSSGAELYVFDRSDPSTPSLLSSYDTGGDINSMIAAGSLLFLATNVSNEEFVIYNVSDPLNVSKEAGLNMAQVATGITFIDNTIYIALRSNDAFQIIQPRP